MLIYNKALVKFKQLIQHIRQNQLIFIPNSISESVIDNLKQITQKRFSERLVRDEQQINIKRSKDYQNFNWIHAICCNHSKTQKSLKKRRIIRLNPKRQKQNSKFQDQKINKLFKEQSKFIIKLNSLNTTPRTSLQNKHISIKTTARTCIPKNTQTKLMLNENIPQFSEIDISKTEIQKNNIPCLLFENINNQPKKIGIYYHGNGEDLITCYQFVRTLSIWIGIDILVVQYPGYSVSTQQLNSSFQTANTILNQTKKLMHYLKRNLNYQQQNIIVIGRSIGSGPAIQVASTYKIGALILLSPFTSFTNIVSNLYGKLAGFVVPNIFKNQQKCHLIDCPVLIIHGQQDKLIPYQQSVQLAAKLKGFCSLKIVPQMTHSKFDFKQDFLLNLTQFLSQIGYIINTQS